MRFAEMDIAGLLRAANFSAEKHRHQWRKGSDEIPYINHPIAVAEILWRVGEVRETSVIIAAILHDTLEDTDATAEEIESLFGVDVRRLVEEVSDNKQLPRAERKRLQVLKASHKSARAKQIKLADKIHNVRDIALSPPAGWSLARREAYLDWSARVVAGLRGVNEKLEKHFDAVWLEAQRKLKAERQSE